MADHSGGAGREFECGMVNEKSVQFLYRAKFSYYEHFANLKLNFKYTKLILFRQANAIDFQ